MDKISEKTEINRRYWDAAAEKFGGKFGKNNIFFLRWFQKKVLDLIDFHENIAFLDVACGSGWAVRTAAGRVQSGKFYGIDLSPKMIELAKKHSEGLENVQFYQTGADSLPFDPDYFDAIICTNAFHHIPDPAAALGEVRRVLKPGGRVYIADGTTDNAVLRFIDGLSRIIEKGHIKQYSTREYSMLFSHAHLTHVASKTLFYPVKVHIGTK